MYQQNADKFKKLVHDNLTQLQKFADASILDASILNLLQEKYPRYYVQLVEPELGDDGFQLTKDKRTHTRIATWLQSTPSTSPTDDGSRAQMPASTRAYDIFSLKYAKRLSLYLEWKEEVVAQTQRSLLANLKAFEKATAEIDKIGAEASHRILARANVIGVTAPDLARNLDLLRRLNSKVLLVEEAGEVLEAHLLTAMLPSIEHAILIGDHQMRPRPLNPSSQVKMDSSLLGRLARSKENETLVVRVVNLEMQHRMHPSISAVMRSAAYPGLRDSLRVSKYPEVSGMRHRLFWLDHREPEDSKRNLSDSISYTNKYEVDKVSALVRHLIRQGVYRACDIALLTPYHSQLRKIHHALGEMRVQLSTSLHGLRLAKTDGFQGEEAKIVIVSLVRSKGQIECTLRTSSRMKVLLSRAQHGMYIVGNAETLTQIPILGAVLETFKNNDNVGPRLELCCPRHPGTLLKVSKPDDFSIVSPEGGCAEPCGQRLPCGHACINKCHSDGIHQAAKCTKPPNMVKGGCSDNSHSECGGQCGEHCIIKASKTDAELPCGHHVNSQNPAQMVCSVPVERIVPGCDHKVTLPCFVDVTAPDYDCRATCGSLRPCGHACGDQCCKCRPRVQGRAEQLQHSECKQTCQQDYTSCKHPCSAPCHGDEACPPCNKPSDVQWETTKDFIVWSHQNYLELARNIQQEQAELIDTRLDALWFDLVNVEMAEGSKVVLLSELSGVNERYDKLSNLLCDCSKFYDQAVADEMPLKSVCVGVVTALRSGGRSVDASGHDQIPLHTRGTILAMSLILRCEILGIIDSLAIYHSQEHEQRRSLDVDFSSDRGACEKLIKLAKFSQDILQQVEGHVFWAQLAVMEFGVMEGRKSYEEIRALAHSHLDNARELCNTYPRQTRSVEGEGHEVSRLLAEGENDFQTRMVVAAVSNDFTGTGHWHRCENGHIFAVGEGDMSLQAARCPQCDALVGGLNQVVVEDA